MILAVTVSSTAIAGTSCTVDYDGLADSSTIKDAVDAASAGDTMKPVQCISSNANLDGVVNIVDVTTTELIILGYM